MYLEVIYGIMFIEVIYLDNKYLKSSEEHNDAKFEKDLRNKIEYLIELFSIEKDSKKRLEYLKNIIGLYDDIRINSLNYTQNDEKEKQKYLKIANDIVSYRYEKLRKDTRYKELIKKASSEQDDSWEDYMHEEEFLDAKDTNIEEER